MCPANSRDVLVERVLQNRFAGEDAGDLVPLRLVLVVGEVQGAGGRRLVVLVRADAGVVDGELLEVGQDRERELRRPGVATELIGGVGIVLDPDRRALGLDEELARPTYAERVIRRLGCPADLDRVLVNDILVRLGVALFVVHVPTERLEERVEKLTPKLCLVVLAREVGFPVLAEPLDEPLDVPRCAGHWQPSGLPACCPRGLLIFGIWILRSHRSTRGLPLPTDSTSV